jgi:hypothetical protein
MIERFISFDKIRAAKELRERRMRGVPEHYTYRPDSKTRWAGDVAERELPIWIREVSDIDARLVDGNPYLSLDVEVAGTKVEVKNCTINRAPTQRHQVIVDRRVYRNATEFFFTFYHPDSQVLYLAGGIDRDRFSERMRVYTPGMEHLPGRRVPPGREKLQLYANEIDDPLTWLRRFGTA